LNIFKKLASGLSTKEGKLKALILFTGLLSLILVITASAMELTSSSQFCQSCHEMRPEYVTWKASAHSQIRCVDCHIEPGTAKFIEYKVKFATELYKHFTGQVYAPIVSDEPIKDIVCERCHTSNRVATPSGDLKIPHRAHKDNKIPCVRCHNAVAHANIADKAFTSDGNWDKWIEPIGRAYMRKDFLTFSMEDCLSCHKEEGVGPEAKNCTACHAKLIKPESHNQPMFTQQHGVMAMTDIKQCDKCHSKTMSSVEPKVPVDNPVVTYARKNTFCAECHSKMKTPPPSHTTTWKLSHVLQAMEDRPGCLVCHDEGKPTRGSTATKTYCYKCHITNMHYNVIVLGKHPKGPQVNASTQPTKDPCFSCHSGAKCLTCHYIPDSKSQLTGSEFRRSLSPGRNLSPGSPGYDKNSPSGGNNSPSPGSFNNPPAETG
jgi:nitrate/TMAO reductase-like tetraheme cytochrome c subunit